MSKAILFLTAEPPWPLDQGDKIRNYHLLRSLAKRHRVTLVTFVSDREVGQWLPSLEPLCRSIQMVKLNRKTMILNVLQLPHLPVTVAARASRRMSFLLQNLTRQEKFDLVMACQLKMAGYLNCCSIPQKVLDLTDVSSVYRARLNQVVKGWPKIFSLLELVRLSYWEPVYARAADLVLLASPADAGVLQQQIKIPVRVIPNGVDTEYFRPLADVSKPALLFFGHLRYPPNADGIVYFCHNILPEIKKAVPDVRLDIAGKEPPPEVKALVADEAVNLLGYVPDLRPHLARTAVVICPVRAGAGTRLKILESLASGRPVVSTSVGCEGLLVEPGRHLEVADDPGAFARKVIDLLTNPAKRVSLAHNGRLLVESRYSWEAIGEQLNTVMEDVF
ncbi:glycosyltransferase [Desulfofundulus thermobenzoicus]|uniref:glycosyltransferase n=1 Tax=Desulfofundulus thermobenzoicus TaxID=29376 RepID=UPI001883AB66